MHTASSSFWAGFTSAAALLYKAIGRRLTCVFVDHGLLRKGESDAILREEISLSGLGRQVSQYFTVLTGNRSVGVMGDERTYDHTVALRAVTTDDFMTADWARLPYDLLARISARIVNEVPRVSRVVFDITTKPPASIEWE